MAATKSGDEIKQLYDKAIEKLEMSNELDGGIYNLACIYAVIQDKENALRTLDKSLSDNEIDIDYVLNDADWVKYLEDEQFNNIVSRYKNSKH